MQINLGGSAVAQSRQLALSRSARLGSEVSADFAASFCQAAMRLLHSTVSYISATGVTATAKSAVRRQSVLTHLPHSLEEIAMAGTANVVDEVISLFRRGPRIGIPGVPVTFRPTRNLATSGSAKCLLAFDSSIRPGRAVGNHERWPVPITNCDQVTAVAYRTIAAPPSLG